MSRFIIRNDRYVDGEPLPIEYDFGGNTRVLEHGTSAEVSFDEAQVALARWQNGGLSLQEIPDFVPLVPDPVPATETEA